MEVVAFGAFLNTFLPKVWEVIIAGDGLREEIEGDIDYLGEELRSVDAYIQEHGLECTSPSSEVTLSGRACRLAEDIELCISRFLFYQTPKKKTHSRDHPKMSHIQFSRHIKEFRRRLDKINEDLEQKKEELKRSTISYEEPEDPQWGEDEELGVGMGVPYQELKVLLEPTPPESDTKGKLKVISIVGFGGSGKTRLAKKVYQEVGKQFDQQAWVCVAKRNVNEVLDALLEMLMNTSASQSTGIQHIDNASTHIHHVDNGAIASTSVQHVDNGSGTSTGIHHINNGSAHIQHVVSGTSVTERLKSYLCKQRYLIVIDDVRSKDDWKNLKRALLDSDVGSRIIVTTTSQPVAELCSSASGHVYKMRTLCDQDSQKLFLNASSRTLLSPANKKQVSTLLKICDGLPLALIESAKPFKEGEEVSMSTCQTTVRNLCAPEGTNVRTLTRMQWVLMNKYSGLASYGARACLLYFHMFPFENLNKSKFLTRQWLAEGLVQRDVEVSDLDAVSSYLKTFRDSNIIRSMQVSNNAMVKSCTLPGTMHHFISRQCRNKDFVTFLRHKDQLPEQKKKDIRRLSLHNSQVQIKGVKLNLLRTLAVSGKAPEAIIDFHKYEVLQVLDLKEWDFHQLDKGKQLKNKLQKKLKDVCKLIMLKYLGLPDNIGEVPRDISYLIHLETLDVGGDEIVTVYGEVIKLPALKHLLGKFCLSPIDSPEKDFAKESILETFSGFVTNEKAAFPKLMKYMMHLKKVKMWCDFEADTGELNHLSAAIKDFIFEGSTDPCDRSLSIDLMGCKGRFLESLETPGSLIKLKLHGTVEKVPEFITPKKVVGHREWIRPPLDGLEELCLSSTTLCKVMPPSDTSPFPLQSDASLLPYLIYLKLVEDELGPLKIRKQHFESLERICLVGKKSISSITIEAGALQSLVSLHVICEHLVGLAGIQIGGLIKLKEIALHSKVSQTAPVGEKSTKDIWKEAANNHPNKPQVLFIEADPTS